MYQIENHGITVTAYDYLAGGIGSVVWNGKEFIDNVHGVSDHGRQLQTAVQYRNKDGAVGEDYNPTECGGMGVHIPGDSASKLIGAGTKNGRLNTTCQAAFWKPYKGKPLSETIIQKSVGIEPWGLDYRVTVDPTGQDEISPDFFNCEVLTGYMPYEFSYAAFIEQDGLIEAKHFRQHRLLPVVMSTADGSHAMGCYLEDASRYAVWRFPDHKVNKWAVVVSDNTPDEKYSWRVKVAIGTRRNVIKTLREFCYG